MMNKKFANPYIVYYPVVSRDGMPFPVNRTVRDIQEELNKGRRVREDQLWRGNLVAAKFADNHFAQMTDASMADFPILKNYLATHVSPLRVTGTALPAATSTPPTPPALASPAQQHQHQHQHHAHHNHNHNHQQPQPQHQLQQQQQQHIHPHANHHAGFPGGPRHMPYPEPAWSHPPAPANGGVPVPMPALRRSAGVEQHL